MQAGLYDENNKLIYNWKELIKNCLISVKDNVFLDINISDISNNACLVIDTTIDSLSECCFASYKLKKIYIPKTIKYIENDTFDNCNLIEIEVDPLNSYFSSENGILYNKNKTKLIKYPPLNEKEGIKIPTTVEIIGHSAFYENNRIKNIKLSENIKEIEAHAFSDSSIEYIEMKGVVKIGNYAFASSGLKKVMLPNTLKYICDSPFEECDDLKEMIYLGNKEQFIKIQDWKNVFDENFLKLENIEFQKTLEDLINEGKNIREANMILKKQQKGIEK